MCIVGNPLRFLIAVSHGTIGTSEQNENYLPFSIENIKNKGFDYWAIVKDPQINLKIGLGIFLD